MLDLLTVEPKFTRPMAPMSYAAADGAHRPPLNGFAAAVHTAPGTDRQTCYHFNTLAAYANCVITKQNSHTHPNSTHELSDDSRPECSEML